MRRRATASIAPVKSTPTTRAVGKRCAASRVSSPVPQPRSRIRWTVPGARNRSRSQSARGRQRRSFPIDSDVVEPLIALGDMREHPAHVPLELGVAAVRERGTVPDGWLGAGDPCHRRRDRCGRLNGKGYSGGARAASSAATRAARSLRLASRPASRAAASFARAEGRSPREYATWARRKRSSQTSGSEFSSWA